MVVAPAMGRSTRGLGLLPPSWQTEREGPERDEKKEGGDGLQASAWEEAPGFRSGPSGARTCSATGATA